MNSIRRGFPVFRSIPLLLGSMITISGCEQKEKVIDIETPAGDIEVERSTRNGKVDVDIDIESRK